MSSQIRLAKDRLYAALAEVSAAFSSPKRLELIDVLAHGPRSVEGLAACANTSFANASQHLQRLKRARLVTDERRGTSVVYRLADPAVARAWRELRDLAAMRNAEVGRALDAYRPRRRRVPAVDVVDAVRAAREGQAILADVRAPEEFAAGHLPGATNVPPDTVDAWSQVPDSDASVIAYCRGPFCRYADDLLVKLAARGLQVGRVESGVLEWLDADVPHLIPAAIT